MNDWEAVYFLGIRGHDPLRALQRLTASASGRPELTKLNPILMNGKRRYPKAELIRWANRRVEG